MSLLSGQSVRGIAAQYRRDEKQWGGWVIVYSGEVAGWSACPRSTDWLPGSVAVGPQGQLMLAHGGDATRGAMGWRDLDARPLDLPK